MPVAAPAPQPSYEKVTLSADVLFDFGKSTLKDAGKAKLDELADRLSGATLDEIKIVGHADRIALAVDPYFLHVADPSTAGVWSLPYVWLYAFQIYFDFSGYTDMARGIAEMMGFRLMLNFNNPYTATGLGDFWARWHICNLAGLMYCPAIRLKLAAPIRISSTSGKMPTSTSRS